MRLLRVSRQQVHRLRATGVLRFEYIKGTRGAEPRYWLPDVIARKESGAKPGRRGKLKRERDWEDKFAYEIANLLFEHYSAALFICGCTLTTRLPLNTTCAEIYAQLVSGRDKLGHLRWTSGESERFKALCLAATNVKFDWYQLAKKTQHLPSECDKWNEFVQRVLPPECRGEVTKIEYTTRRY